MHGAQQQQEQARFGLAMAVKKLTRDFMVTVVATGLFTYEILLGGGRPAVLTACVSLLLSPVIMRVDEARRVQKDEDDAQ